MGSPCSTALATASAAVLLLLLLCGAPTARACTESPDDGGGNDRMISAFGSNSPSLINADPPASVRIAQEAAAQAEFEAQRAAQAAQVQGYSADARTTSNQNFANYWPPGSPGDVPWVSKKWGKAGELWKSATTQIMDISYAGYKEGKVWPPSPISKNVYNVKEWGAKGNGLHDDTNAINAALGTMMTGVLYFPKGTYLIKRPINVNSNLVLMGAGQGKTTFHFPNSFTDLYGNNNIQGSDRSRYSGGPFFINFNGYDNPGHDAYNHLANIKADASKGARVLTVDNTRNISVGHLVRLAMTDPGQGQMIRPMLSPVYCTTQCDPASCGPWGDMGNITRMYGRYDLKFYRHFSYVTAKTGKTITLERPLPFRIDKSWYPIVEKYAPTMQRAGVQDLSIKFRMRNYLGHFHEWGYNAINMNGGRDCWVRNVDVHNADIAIHFGAMSFSTVDNVQLMADKGRYHVDNNTGHHGVWIVQSSDNVISRVNNAAQYVHDIALENSAINNVITRGTGWNVNVDFHRYMPWGNTITDTDCGNCYRLYVSSGAGGKGPHAGPFNTFWNIHTSLPTIWLNRTRIMWREMPPSIDWGPKFNFIGVFGQNITWTPLSQFPNSSRLFFLWSPNAKTPVKKYNPGWWVEYKAQGGLRPTNLWNSMVQTRKKRLAAQPKTH